MIEFDETLSTKYSGNQAIIKRVQTRLKHTTSDIPYYERGVDLFEFTYGSKEVALRLGLRDFAASVELDSENSRVQVYNVKIDIDELV